MTTYIVPWSGGLDSTACLVWAIRQRKDGDRVVAIHTKQDTERMSVRGEGQLRSVYSLREAIEEHIGTFAFMAIAVPLGTKFTGGDMVWAFTGVGLVLGSCRYPRPAIVWGLHNDQGGHSAKRQKACEDVLRGCAGDDIDILIPFRLSTKQQLVATLPPYLPPLTWTCLYGDRDEGTLTECGGCRACIARQQALQPAAKLETTNG